MAKRKAFWLSFIIALANEATSWRAKLANNSGMGRMPTPLLFVQLMQRPSRRSMRRCHAA